MSLREPLLEPDNVSEKIMFKDFNKTDAGELGGIDKNESAMSSKRMTWVALSAVIAGMLVGVIIVAIFAHSEPSICGPNGVTNITGAYKSVNRVMPFARCECRMMV